MTTSTERKSQSDKFKDLARELETDESEETFDRTLRKVAKPSPDKGGKSEKGKPAK